MKRATVVALSSVFCLLGSLPCRSQSYERLVVKRISENIVIVQSERGSGNCLALRTDEGLVVFGTSWGPGRAMEYREMIVDAFDRDDFSHVINADSRITGIGGNGIYENASIIAQEETFREILRTRRNLEAEIRREIAVFSRKAQRSRGILEDQDISESDRSLHRSWMDHCQRIADDLDSGYELVTPSLVFREELILALGNMDVHLRHFPDNGLIVRIPDEDFLGFTGMFDPMHIITSALRPTNGKLEIDRWIEILDEITEECKDVEQVVLGYKGFWPMSKIVDRKEYIEHLWNGIKRASAEDMSIEQAREELSIDAEFAYVKEWDVYRERGEDWVREDHDKIISAFWRQLHPPQATCPTL